VESILIAISTFTDWRIDNINPVKVSSKRTAIVSFSGQDDRAESVTNIKVWGSLKGIVLTRHLNCPKDKLSFKLSNLFHFVIVEGINDFKQILICI